MNNKIPVLGYFLEKIIVSHEFYTPLLKAKIPSLHKLIDRLNELYTLKQAEDIVFGDTPILYDASDLEFKKLHQAVLDVIFYINEEMRKAPIKFPPILLPDEALHGSYMNETRDELSKLNLVSGFLPDKFEYPENIAELYQKILEETYNPYKFPDFETFKQISLGNAYYFIELNTVNNKMVLQTNIVY